MSTCFIRRLGFELNVELMKKSSTLNLRKILTLKGLTLNIVVDFFMNKLKCLMAIKRCDGNFLDITF